MDIITAKEHLHKEGYCEFQLKEFDENAYNLFLSLKFKQNDSKYLENFKNIRFDYINDKENDVLRVNKLHLNHNDAINAKNEFLKNYDKNYIAQIWLSSFHQPTNIEELSKTYKDIFSYFYPNPIEDLFFGFQWTCYSDGCFLKDHNDGQGDYHQNICAILIYLNEDWKTEWGGNLLLRNTRDTSDINIKTNYKVIPEFGKVTIIDLGVFDTAHAVDTIIGDHNRCALLTFVTNKSLKTQQII